MHLSRMLHADRIKDGDEFRVQISAWKVWNMCHFVLYTQTKKKRPIFMLLCFSIQLRCCNKNKTKMLVKRPTNKTW